MSRVEETHGAALEYSISRAPIFAGLPPDDLRRLSAYCSLKSLCRGSCLFRQGDPVVGFFIIRQGLVKVYRLSGEGREQVVHLLRSGDSFAERAITSGNGYPASARAVEESEVILIPKEEFKAHLRLKPDLAWRMVTSMSHHLRSLVNTLEGLRFNDIEVRLMHWLLERCPDRGSEVSVDIVFGTTKGELALELATRPETLSRTFRKLRLAGFIEVHPRLVVVRDPSRLQQHFHEKTR